MAILNKPVIAAFDFDGTLTKRDSLIPFLIFSFGKVIVLKKFLSETPSIIQFLIGLISRQDLKERILTRFFEGMPKSQFIHLAEDYSISTLHSLVKKEGLDRIKWHRSQGHRCILISANLDAYLTPWAKANGFDDVITSIMEYSSDDIVTGHLVGLNCRTEEKVKRLINLVGPLKEYTIYAYGDSRGDKELLDIADYPFYRKLR